jgi:hypothetical protein
MEFKIDAAEERKILDGLHQMRHDRTLKWVSFGYSESGERVEFRASGGGALDEIRGLVDPAGVLYVVFETMVAGDELNPIKYVLMTWIGDGVPPGLAKARPSAHRRAVLDMVKKELAVAAELQPSSTSDISSEMIAQAIMRRRGEEASAGASSTHDARAQLSEKAEAKKLSNLTLVREAEIANALRAAREGGHYHWAMCGYVAGKRDEVAYVGSGVGFDALLPHLREDAVLYIYFLFNHVEPTQTTLKSLLVTFTGPKVPALMKARSGGHRESMFKYVLSLVPCQSQYQADSSSEVSEASFCAKLRI